ncbi:MAG: PilW family protein [Rhodanobacter sp.]
MSKLPVNQRGISLISLMIALLIGSFLLAGLFQVWFQTRQTFSAQAQLAQLQDNERMALTIMANTVQTGGYYPIYLNYPPNTPPSTPYSIGGSFPVIGDYTVAGQSIFGTGTASTTGTGDTLEVRFVADSNTLDCLGQPDLTGSLVVNTYAVVGTNLQCTVNVTTSAGAKTATGPLTVVAGVKNMTVTYNVAIPGTTTNQYMNATTVAADTDWAHVQSANITLTFNNPLFGQPGQPATVSPISRVVAITVPNPNP